MQLKHTYAEDDHTCFYIAACLAPPTDSHVFTTEANEQVCNDKHAPKTTSHSAKLMEKLCLHYFPSDPNIGKEGMNFIINEGQNLFIVHFILLWICYKQGPIDAGFQKDWN